MGGVQAVPVLGEVVTVAEVSTKALAAGVCYPFSKEVAGKLIDGCDRSITNYAEVNAIAANINLAVAAYEGDSRKVKYLRKKQEEAWLSIVDSTPVVGHVKGIVHYAQGDAEKGDACMISASRTTAVTVATVFTAGSGALVCGLTAASAGLGTDIVTTTVDSAVKKEFRPAGFCAAVNRAVETKDPNDVFSAVALPVCDFASAAVAAKVSKARSGAPSSLPEPVFDPAIDGIHIEPLTGPSSFQGRLPAGFAEPPAPRPWYNQPGIFESPSPAPTFPTELMQNANRIIDKPHAELTHAGRAFAKHAHRPVHGPKLTGGLQLEGLPSNHVNAAARCALSRLWEAADAMLTEGNCYTEIFSEELGYGFRWRLDGKPMGFLDTDLMPLY